MKVIWLWVGILGGNGRGYFFQGKKERLRVTMELKMLLTFRFWGFIVDWDMYLYFKH